MMSRCPQCYIPSFRENGLQVPEKKIFEGFLPIYGHGGHLGHVTSIMSSIFFLYLKASIQNLVQNSTVVSEKILSESLCVHYLGPRSRNDLDLQYSHNFINLIRCLLLPYFRSLAAIVSEKSTIFIFTYGKAQITKFDLAIK